MFLLEPFFPESVDITWAVPLMWHLYFLSSRLLQAQHVQRVLILVRVCAEHAPVVRGGHAFLPDRSTPSGRPPEPVPERVGARPSAHSRRHHHLPGPRHRRQQVLANQTHPAKRAGHLLRPLLHFFWAQHLDPTGPGRRFLHQFDARPGQRRCAQPGAQAQRGESAKLHFHHHFAMSCHQGWGLFKSSQYRKLHFIIACKIAAVF